MDSWNNALGYSIIALSILIGSYVAIEPRARRKPAPGDEKRGAILGTVLAVGGTIIGLIALKLV